MTLRTLKRKHKAMWLWLAANPKKRKVDWEEYMHYQGKPTPAWTCYACIAACIDSNINTRSCALRCPIDWPGAERIERACCFSTYKQWGKSTNLKERSRLATEIANYRWHNRSRK